MSPSTATKHEQRTAPIAESPETPSSSALRQRTSVWQRVGNVLPAIVVVAVLATLAVWGHSTNWTLPKFSEFLGSGEEKKQNWCAEHNVPESQCIECNKNLITPLKDYGWCEMHGVAQCPLHHPDVAQVERASITDEDMRRATMALATLPREENNKNCKMYQKRIQFASTETVEKAGIDVAIAQQQPIIEAVTANGEVVYDETRTAHLASRVTGAVWRVERRVGDQVRQGDILALIEAAEVGRLKSDLLQAISQLRVSQTNVEKLKPLAKDGAVAGKALLEAEASLHEAEIKVLSAQQALVNLGLPVKVDEFTDLSIKQVAKEIQFLGLPEALTASFNKDSTTSNLFPLRSPLDGVVVQSKVVAGETVDTAASIFGVTDVRHMWLILDVRQDDARRLSLGQPVLFHATDSKFVPKINGSVSWISTEADDKTRTVKVRVDLSNSDWNLRANTFGTGRIVLREEPKAVVVPTEAVHSDGDCRVVFVRDKNYLIEGAPKFFHVREVRLGATNSDRTEVIVGVLPGEVVASKNSAVLEAQLLKGNLAGDDD